MTLPGLVAARNLADVTDRERAWDNIGSGLASIAIPQPSLDCRFAEDKNLIDNVSNNNVFTLSRASTGTYTGDDGFIKIATTNEARFNYDSLTFSSQGLLVEEARTNLINIGNVPGTRENYGKISRTVVNNILTPFGDLSSVAVFARTAGTTPGPETIGPSGSLALVAGIRHTFSVFYKPLTGSFSQTLLPTFLAQSFTPSFYQVQSPSLHTLPFVQYSNGWTRYYWTVLIESTRSDYISAIKMTSNAGAGQDISAAFWGLQVEAGGSLTSYIPTTGSTVTRSADVAIISSENFPSTSAARVYFYDSSFKTIATINNGTTSEQVQLSASGTQGRLAVTVNGSVQSDLVTGAGLTTALNGIAASFGLTKNSAVINSGAASFAFGLAPTVNRLQLISPGITARLTLWNNPLTDEMLRAVSAPSNISTIDLILNVPFTIKGRDVLALETVKNTSTRDFIFIKGLLSAAQPRLTAAAATTSSGLTLVANALPKLAPSSNGNYFFASGLTLSGVTTRINGTNALSIATSPFSGSTATAPLLFSELRPQANWRITEPMPSGTIASPEFAIPFETNNFVLFMKAGQN